MTTDKLTEGLYKDVLNTEQELLGREFFGKFLNWGYWTAETEHQIQACENLANLVLDLIPTLGGPVLEVGCGIGGVTVEIAKRVAAADITAINVLDEQLEQCRQLIPEASFVRMDAADMRFEPGSFGAIVSVEAAHHFSSRADFFRGALEALEPGGYLSLCDIIGYPFEGRGSHVANPAAYQALLLELGFCEVRVLDITADSAHAHADYIMGWLRARHERGELDQARFDLAGIGRVVRMALSPYYVAACARKPIPGKPSWRARPNEHIDAYLRELVVKTAYV